MLEGMSDTVNIRARKRILFVVVLVCAALVFGCNSGDAPDSMQPGNGRVITRYETRDRNIVLVARYTDVDGLQCAEVQHKYKYSSWHRDMIICGDMAWFGADSDYGMPGVPLAGLKP